MAALAELPNVMCKISGVITEAHHSSWQIAQIAPYIEHALAVFGEDCVAFGSDWPVLRLAASYHAWIEALDALLTNHSAEAQRKLWAENARRFYRLS
jgi:L-fuconolactonase